MSAELNTPIGRRGLLTLLAGAATLPLLSACGNNTQCRTDYIARYKASHGGADPSPSEVDSACATSRTRNNRTGSRTGTGYRGSRRGGSSSSSGGK